MKINRRIWAVDPGWQGMKGSRGAWSEVAIKGVALATSQEQTRLCQHALLSCRLIQKFSEARGCPKCKASFSLVKPGTVIPAHAGPTNSRLRAHLGLIIPKGDLYMKIGNQTVGWKPGQWTIIDDSFQHEVVNDSKGDRLILIVDFRHPEVGEDSENEFSFSKEKMKSSGLEREDVISSGFLPPENNLE
ncbi:aspartyl/asparaginyl beta-hydroxylase [Eurytemora carolleeae]|uniref:aspartyl/asparaginyl beta-hydroxylase n=1 Tax=Eurytemora carolleeae TaxID=1294199 RepID=UPI000C78A2A4|nr:aspartyl/asparaginyl beta-hydroxylase [Eurytemora carolleeae]|eukprot:XP_023338434.1 aspartyl/asparaginyl beta-hydroxylase-like [Eurytemora affinis]